MIKSILTGEVVAVYGRVVDSGTFEIEDWVRKGSSLMIQINIEADPEISHNHES